MRVRLGGLSHFGMEGDRLAVGFFAFEATVAEFDFLAPDVVSEPPAAAPEPVLAIALRNAFQLLDVV